MKRKTAFLFCLIAGAICSQATNVYSYDFEADATSPLGVSAGGWTVPESVMVTDNPVTDGINSSSKCFTFEAQDGTEWWGGPLLTLKQETTTESVRYLYLKVLAEDDVQTNFQIGLFNGKDDNGNPKELGIYLTANRATTLGKKWKEFCFVIAPGTTFDCIRLQARHWGTYYIDDIRLSDEAPVIPLLSPFLIDFESETSGDGWSTNSASGKGAAYRSTVNQEPYITATIKNNSSNCMRAWIENGGWSDYDGARDMNVYGYTTEDAHYLHVKYYFHSNEDHPDQYNLPLCVFTEDGDNCYKSMPCLRNQWNDVTIDLGVGTLIKYLAFNVNDYWVTAGFDDIQLDGNPNERDVFSGVTSVKEAGIKIFSENGTLRLVGINEPTSVQITTITGVVHYAQTLLDDGAISLVPGIYVVKISTAKNIQVQKVIIK